MSMLVIFSGCQDVESEVQAKGQVFSRLETESQALGQFLSSGESARIKARLTQIGRYWEELKENVEQLDGQLEENHSQQQKFDANLEEVRSSRCLFCQAKQSCVLMCMHI